MKPPKTTVSKRLFKQSKMEIIVTDIEYDTDGFDVELPTELTILVPEGTEDIEQFISDEISNITGYCHKGFITNLD